MENKRTFDLKNLVIELQLAEDLLNILEDYNEKTEYLVVSYKREEEGSLEALANQTTRLHSRYDNLLMLIKEKVNLTNIELTNYIREEQQIIKTNDATSSELSNIGERYKLTPNEDLTPGEGVEGFYNIEKIEKGDFNGKA